MKSKDEVGYSRVFEVSNKYEYSYEQLYIIAESVFLIKNGWLITYFSTPLCPWENIITMYQKIKLQNLYTCKINWHSRAEYCLTCMMMYQYNNLGTCFAIQMTGPSHSLDDHMEMTVLLVHRMYMYTYERGVVTQMSHDTSVRCV